MLKENTQTHLLTLLLNGLKFLKPPAFTYLICPLQFLKNGKQEMEGSNPIYKGSKPIGPGVQGVLSWMKWLPILITKIKRKCKMYLADNLRTGSAINPSSWNVELLAQLKINALKLDSFP